MTVTAVLCITLTMLYICITLFCTWERYLPRPSVWSASKSCIGVNAHRQHETVERYATREDGVCEPPGTAYLQRWTGILIFYRIWGNSARHIITVTTVLCITITLYDNRITVSTRRVLPLWKAPSHRKEIKNVGS